MLFLNNEILRAACPLPGVLETVYLVVEHQADQLLQLQLCPQWSCGRKMEWLFTSNDMHWVYRSILLPVTVDDGG